MMGLLWCCFVEAPPRYTSCLTQSCCLCPGRDTGSGILHGDNRGVVRFTPPVSLYNSFSSQQPETSSYQQRHLKLDTGLVFVSFWLVPFLRGSIRMNPAVIYKLFDLTLYYFTEALTETAWITKYLQQYRFSMKTCNVEYWVSEITKKGHSVCRL